MDKRTSAFTDNDHERPALILASASPRRRELMSLLERPFTVETADVDETVPDDIPIDDTAEYLATLKARSVYAAHGEENGKITVIGSDTIVVLDGKIYGKPHDAADASRMLKSLSGRTHEVRTGVAIISGGHFISFTSSSSVEFYELSDDEISEYIKTGEPMDKAGAYGIQGHGALLVRKIDGDFYTVMGFPIAEVARSLTQNGV